MKKKSVAVDQLKNLVERIEGLEDEKRNLAADIRAVYAEAKGTGYDPKVIRQVIRERRKDSLLRSEFNTLFDTYANAVGLD